MDQVVVHNECLVNDGEPKVLKMCTSEFKKQLVRFKVFGKSLLFFVGIFVKFGNTSASLNSVSTILGSKDGQRSGK